MTLKKLGKTSILFMISLLAFTGCSNNSDIVATMKGHKVSSEEFLNELNLSRTTYQLAYATELSDEDNRTLALHTIQHLTLLEAFATEGEKLKLNPSEEEVEALFKETKAETSDIEGMQDILDSTNYTDEAIRENIYKTETALNYYTYLKDSISYSTADAKAFYEKHKDSKYSREIVDADHILIKTADINEEGIMTPFSDEEISEAKKKADDILKKVEAGEDFNKLAKKYSEDEGTKEDGGKLGTFSKGDMVQEFEEAAFKLEAGKTSKLVKTIYGYHIIKVNSKETNQYNFDDISYYVGKDLLGELLLKEISKIENKYNIKTNNELVSSLLDNLEPATLSDTDNSKDTKEDSKEDSKVDSKEDSNDSSKSKN